ncbi:MAG: hypothetical protein J5711_07090 [Bacteroidales bacterium]|nr:hypothetical protein [Bacteroidales bacterium]
MRKIVILILFSLSASIIQAQVVSCHRKVLRRTKTEKVERVNYRLCLYEFSDTAILRKTMCILSLNPIADSIRRKSEKVTYILTMQFEQVGDDTLVCHAYYSDLPYMQENLRGCCLIDGHYVQIIGVIPPFMTPTKSTTSFSYISHKLILGEYNGRVFYFEDMGDDRAPQWDISYSRGAVQLLKYHGIND